MLHVNMAFVLYFSFHELHVRSMQIYEKLILHLQMKIDFSILLAERRAGLFFKYKFPKQITCFAFKIILS